MSESSFSSSTSFRLGLFFSIFWWYQRRERRKQKRLNDINFLHDAECEDNKSNKFLNESANVGPRGIASMKKAVSYWDGFLRCLQVRMVLFKILSVLLLCS